MTKKIIALCCMAACVVLMALPFGVVMRFGAPPPEEPYVSYHSYFSLTPFAYANWFPMIATVLSVVVLLALTFDVARKKDRAGKLVPICLFVCMAASPLAWLMAGWTVTAIGGAVFVLHTVAFATQIKRGKKP